MKKLLLVICLFFSLGTFAQSKDSVTQEMVNKYVDTLTRKTSLQEFQKFLYETVSAKEYSETSFSQLYQFFIQSKINTWIQSRAKPKK